MSIGLGEPFESMIISLSRFRTSCIFSCYWYFSIVICDKNRPISLTLKNIGTGSSYNKRIKCNKLLKSKDTLSRGIVTDNSTKLHVVKKMKFKHFWVDAIFYCNGIWIELKNLILNKYLIYNKQPILL